MVGSSSRSSTGEVRSARASATFCCVPRERFSIALRAPRDVGVDPVEDQRDPLAGLPRGQPVEPGGVGEVLGRRHLLEERGFDRDAVHHRAHRPGLGDVVAEDARGAAVRQEQGGERPEQRRLPRAVLAEDRDALAAADLEGDPSQRGTRVRLRPSFRTNSLRRLWTSTAFISCSSDSGQDTDSDPRPPAGGARGTTCQPKSNIEPPRLADVSAGAQMRRGRGPTGAGLDQFASSAAPPWSIDCHPSGDDTNLTSSAIILLLKCAAAEGAHEGKDASGLRVLGLFFWSKPTNGDQADAQSDWPAVKAIFEQGIATKNATFDTEAPAWEDWDASHLAEPRLVAERSGAVVAWAALSPVSRRPCYAGVVENSIYVDETARGQGIGREFLGELVARRRRRDLDGPGVDLPRERRQHRAAQALRFPRGRSARADRAARRRLAGHRPAGKEGP